jgi:hypothetical protein
MPIGNGAVVVKPRNARYNNFAEMLLLHHLYLVPHLPWVNINEVVIAFRTQDRPENEFTVRTSNFGIVLVLC